MSDLKVDYETLEAAARTADGLQRDFDGLPRRVDDTSSIWGHSAVAGAVHTFGTNWGYHREVLSDEIKKTGEKIAKCLEAFEKADQKLADELHRHAHEGAR